MEIFFPQPEHWNKLERKGRALAFEPLLQVLNHQLLIWLFAESRPQFDLRRTRRHERKNRFEESLQLLVVPICFQNEWVFDANDGKVFPFAEREISGGITALPRRVFKKRRVFGYAKRFGIKRNPSCAHGLQCCDFR